MKKEYQFKTYSKSNIYKHTINPKIVMSDVRFSETMNGGQGQLTVKLDLSFSDTTFLEGDLIKVTEYDTNNPDGIAVYFWFISKIKRKEDTNSKYIELVCLGIASLLKSINFYDGSYNPTKNQDPAQTIKDSIDYFNTQYWGSLISYSDWHIDNYWSSVSLWFEYEDCLEVINKASDTTDFRWFINAEGQVYFQAKPTEAIHKLTNKKDVELLTLENTLESITNKLFLTRDGGTIKIYEDIVSQGLYGIKEKTMTKSDLNDESAQDIFGNNYILENKNPKDETKIVVNSEYNLEIIKPWNTVKVLNIDYLIENLQVLGVSYHPDKITLTIEKLVSFGKEVVS